MILVIDIGNTNVVLGLYHQDQLTYHWKLATDRTKTADEWAMTIRSLFNFSQLIFEQVNGIIIASVVPTIMYDLEQMCKKYFQQKPLVIGPGIKTGLNIKYDNPKEVGADRIVNAVAAISLFKGPIIIVDFGTAITYCYINEENEYIGGAIAPGLSISTEALYTEASKLPRIEVTRPPQIIGRNTIHAMQSGIFYGFLSQVEGMVERIKTEYNSNPTVIATGGHATLIASESQAIDVVEPLLTLKGLYMIYQKNKL